MQHIIIQMRWFWLFIILFTSLFLLRFSCYCIHSTVWSLSEFSSQFITTVFPLLAWQPGVLFSLQYYIAPIRPRVCRAVQSALSGSAVYSRLGRCFLLFDWIPCFPLFWKANAALFCSERCLCPPVICWCSSGMFRCSKMIACIVHLNLTWTCSRFCGS